MQISRWQRLRWLLEVTLMPIGFPTFLSVVVYILACLLLATLFVHHARSFPTL